MRAVIALDWLFRRRWQQQSRMLVLLCAGLLGTAQPAQAGQGAGLLQLAAARVLVLLLDSDSWGCFAKGLLRRLTS